MDNGKWKMENDRRGNPCVYPFLLLIFIIFFFASCKKEDIIHTSNDLRTDVLIIQSTDSFINSGLASIVIEEFERQYECTIYLVNQKNGDELLNQLIANRENPVADIAMGILSTQFYRALQSNLFMQNDSELVRPVNDSVLLVDSRNRLIPYNYTYYGFVYDSEIIPTPPKTLGEMQSSIWNNRIITIDPSVSPSSRGKLLWSLGIFGERCFEQFWRTQRASIINMASNFDEAYTAFLAGEAPVIFSHVTTPFIYQEIEGLSRYKSFIPSEGTLKEIEFAGIISGSQNLYLARRFLEFMLSENFQSHVPTTLWRFPVINDIDLPLSFTELEIPENDLSKRIFERPNFYNTSWIDLWLLTVNSTR